MDPLQIALPKPSTTPICPYFYQCGGCHLQDVAYSEQIDYKSQWLRTVFQNITTPTTVWLPFIRSKKSYPLYFRNKIRFGFVEEQGRLYPSRHHKTEKRDIAVEDCFLQSPLSMELTKLTADFATTHQWKLFDSKTGTGWLKHLLIREGKHTSKLLLSLVTTQCLIPDFDLYLNEVRNLSSNISSIYQTKTIGNDNSASEDVLLWGDEALHEQVGPWLFRISPHAFFQTNSELVGELYEAVTELTEYKETSHVWDLYAGSATIGIYLSKKVKSVLSVESNPHSIRDAQWNINYNKVNNLTILSAQVEELHSYLLQDKLQPPDCIIVDPPRAGLSRSVLENLASLKPTTLTYVSCNPYTCARDCSFLTSQGFSLIKIQGLDMFPHSLHCEVIVQLKQSDFQQNSRA